MIRFVLLGLVIAAVVWWLRGLRRKGPPADAAGPAAPPADEAPVMAVCAHCGVHVPRTEALPGPDGLFCSESHRQAGPVQR